MNVSEFGQSGMPHGGMGGSDHANKTRGEDPHHSMGGSDVVGRQVDRIRVAKPTLGYPTR